MIRRTDFLKMEYRDITTGRFLERPNRFIARVEIEAQDGTRRVETVHVKNTGRCRELLQRGATVYLEKSHNPARSSLRLGGGGKGGAAGEHGFPGA